MKTSLFSFRFFVPSGSRLRRCSAAVSARYAVRIVLDIGLLIFDLLLARNDAAVLKVLEIGLVRDRSGLDASEPLTTLRITDFLR